MSVKGKLYVLILKPVYNDYWLNESGYIVVVRKWTHD